MFSRARRTTARVEGPPDRLELLRRIVEGSNRMLPAELEAVRLPHDLAQLAAVAAQREDEVKEHLDAGRLLVETAERLVCRLYALPQELEDAVIAHATERAVRSEPAEAVE